MAGSMNLQWIKGSLATSDNTFAEDEILMPKAKGSMLPAIKEIHVLHPKMSNLANKFSKWHLAIHSEDEIQDLDDSYTIESRERVAGTNAAPVNVEDKTEVVVYSFPVPVSVDKIYFGAHQDSGSSHTYKYKIGYVPRYVAGVRQQQQMHQVEY